MDSNGRDHFSSERGGDGSAEGHGLLHGAEHFIQSVMADMIRGLLKESVDRLPAMVESQLRLARDEARAELREIGRKAAHVAAPLALGLAFAIFALGFALLAMVHVLAMVMTAWVAALIVAVLTAIVALALISVGKQRFHAMHLNTNRPIEKVAENIKSGVTRLANTQ